jgi:hypothetical protein
MPIHKVDLAIPGVINQTTAIVLYRDIPLNAAECNGECLTNMNDCIRLSQVVNTP